MKNIILIFSFITIFMFSCQAQKPVALMKASEIKVANNLFSIKKLSGKYTQVTNLSNKLVNVPQNLPNLPSDAKIGYNMKFDERLLTDICAKVIPLDRLKKMPLDKNSGLFMSIKINIEGYPIEIQFLIKDTSLITIEELEKIEKNIKNSQFRVVFNNQIKPFLRGGNYVNIDAKTYYVDMLKIKENK